MNVTSNIKLIKNEINSKIENKLNDISKIISFEKYEEKNETLTSNNGEENEVNN